MKGRSAPIAAVLVVMGLGIFVLILTWTLYGAPAVPAGAPLVSSTSTVPVRLLIPSLSIDAKVQKVGLTKNGEMGIPTNFTDVAWYEYGPVPGAPGNAVIDGHVDNALGLAGVFKHLSELKLGDEIRSVNVSGETLTFIVSEIQHLPHNPTSTADIFRTSGPSGLVLITCEGAWDQSLREYSDRLVVFAELRQ